MPKLLIPFYALDPGAWTITATPAALGETLPSFELQCAMDCDQNNFTWIYGLEDQPIVITYSTTFATTDFTTKLSAEYGSNAIWACYLRIENALYEVPDTQPHDITIQTTARTGSVYTNRTTGVYGDGDFVRGRVLLGYTPTARIDALSDGELVIYSSLVGSGIPYAKHKIVLDNQDGVSGGNFKFYHVLDGLLVTLPDVPLYRQWEEDWQGGTVSEGPTGKVLFTGFKSIHTHRGKRRFSIIWPELNAEDVVNVSEYRRESYGTYTLYNIRKLMNCFIAGKGCIPVLYMHDETDNGTWVLSKMINLTISEPGGGLFTAEMAFEEY